MNKQEIDKIVKDVFKANPTTKEVFVTSDGSAFLSENYANLHKNTNKSGKKLEVICVQRTAFKAIAKDSKSASNKAKTLSQMNRTELLAVANEKNIDVSTAKNNKEIVTLIKKGNVKQPVSNENKDNQALSEMNETLLTELATSKGIEVPEDATKAEIIKLIETVTNAEIK